MTEVLRKVKQWLDTNAPQIGGGLNPGASDQEIEQFISDSGLSLPDEWSELYRWSNGQPEDSIGVFFGVRFLPIEEVQSTMALWADLLEMNEEFDEGDIYSEPDGYIKKLYANDKWVPITHDDCGNHIGIDLDPDSQGAPGQVIIFGRDEDVKKLVAPDLRSFLEIVLAQLESGNYRLDGREFSLKSYLDGTPMAPDCAHFHNAFPIKSLARTEC